MTVRTRKLRNRTRGLTLIELVMTVVIASASMAVLFGVIIYLYQINQISYEQGFQLESARRGVETMVTDIREAAYADDGSFPLVSIDPYSIVLYSDTDKDSSVEKVRYFLSGTNWKRGVTNATGTPPTYPSTNERVTIVSDFVRNNEQSLPIFHYYDSSGAEITNMTLVSNVTFVKADLVVNISPTHLPDEFLLRSSATIRNLRPNP